MCHNIPPMIFLIHTLTKDIALLRSAIYLVQSTKGVGPPFETPLVHNDSSLGDNRNGDHRNGDHRNGDQRI